LGASGPVWSLIVALIAGLVLFDYLFSVRRANTPTLREAVVWSASYLGIAIMFGLGVWAFGGISMGVEYFACYVSNEALSIDNLFVFLFIVSSFAVPRIAQQKVLLFGIVLALAVRTGFIFIGAALITIFNWAFYLFAIVLLIMATNLAKSSESKRGDTDTVLIRIARRLVRTSEDYDGDRLLSVEHGRRVMTPMLLVMLAVGGADILFAFDSIPALFGLSQNVYPVFSATALSLLGLRQPVFLDRRSARPVGLPVLRSRGDLGFHRCEHDAAGLARQQHSVHQRRQPGPRHRTEHTAVVDGDHRHHADHDGSVTAVTTRTGATRARRGPPARCGMPQSELRRRPGWT
jgi:tellurite resistance protein TerC